MKILWQWNPPETHYLTSMSSLTCSCWSLSSPKASIIKPDRQTDSLKTRLVFNKVWVSLGDLRVWTNIFLNGNCNLVTTSLSWNTFPSQTNTKNDTDNRNNYTSWTTMATCLFIIGIKVHIFIYEKMISWLIMLKLPDCSLSITVCAKKMAMGVYKLYSGSVFVLFSDCHFFWCHDTRKPKSIHNFTNLVVQFSLNTCGVRHFRSTPRPKIVKDHGQEN